MTQTFGPSPVVTNQHNGRVAGERSGLSTRGSFCEGLERVRRFVLVTACLEGRFSTNLSYSRSMVPFLGL